MYDYWLLYIQVNYQHFVSKFFFWISIFLYIVHGACSVPNKLVYSVIFFLEHEHVRTRLLGRTEYA